MENALLERARTQFDNLKTLSEELQVQMALGKAEARDLFEVESKNLSTYVKKQRIALDQREDISNENRSRFLSVVQKLESSLADPTPTENKDYDKYKNDVLHTIFEIEELTKEIGANLGEDIQRKLDSFKNKMDAYRVNLALHDKDNPEKVERVRRDFSEKLLEIRSVLSNHENSQAKINHFVEDINKSFDYLKRAISDLSND